MKRFSVLLCVSLLCLMLAAPRANAAEVSSEAVALDLAAGSVEIYESEGITYCVQNGETQATTGGVIIRQTNGTATANTVTVTGGSCTVAISSLNIEAEDYESPILVEKGAALELNLISSSTVTGGDYRAGIQVPEGASLSIDGSGSITAIGGHDGAGIGGGYMGAGGTITINGGTVTATAGLCGAGIGGGYSGGSGTITISGGTVTATGGAAAGIGGGMQGDGSTVTIYGGTVIATSTGDGAGIGGSYHGDGGTITIYGGTVTATGGDDNADIGAGRAGTIDAVTISENATVTTDEGNMPYIVETIFIDKQPLPSVAHLNNNPNVSVTAHGHSGLSFQWEISSDNKTWSEMEDEIAFETGHFTMSEALVGSYLRCKLTNGWGNVEYTDAVQIYVLAFEKQPVSVEADLDDMIVFEALSTCSNVTYRWQRSYDEGVTWADVPGETFSTLIINATLSESAAKYRCVITATNGDELASDVVSVNLDLGDLVTYTVQDFLQDTDGSGYTMKSQQILEGLSGITVTAPEDGYDGFALNSEKSTLSGNVAEDNSLILTRYFDRNTYSITFNTNGGSALPDLEALYGASITAPGDPTRYGQVFDGWYADKALTEEYVFDTMPLDGAAVYAKWAPVGADRGIEYTVNGLAIRDSSTYELLDDIPTGTFLAEVSVTNLEATETDTVLLVCYTAEGQMVGMHYLFANTPVGYTATFGTLVDNREGNIGIIKAFVLPSLGSPVPLAEAKELR